MKALVIGGSGLVGGHLVRALVAAGWETAATQRTPPRTPPATHRAIALDLLDPASVQALPGQVAGVSHVFFLARTLQKGYRIERESNVRVLEAVLDVLQDLPSLRHVQLVHGLKWYGSTAGPFPVPARESDPVPGAAHFYYDQHALVRERARGRPWHWSTLRPHCVSGVATHSPSNVMLGMAVYAQLMKEQGLPLAFPGSQAAFDARLTYTSADLLARAMLWAATDPAARDEDFNVANGDVFSWSQVWPAVAAAFGMEAAPPRPQALRDTMPPLADLWSRVVQRDALVSYALPALVDWNFMDATLALAWEQTMSLGKLRRHGFGETVDTPAMILEIIQAYRRLRILPAP